MIIQESGSTAYAEEESRSDERDDDAENVEDCRVKFIQLGRKTSMEERKTNERRGRFDQAIRRGKSVSSYLWSGKEYLRRRGSIL